MPVPQEPATIEGSPAVRHGDRSRDVTPQGAVLKMAATIRPKRIPLPNILCLAAQQMERGERARKEAYVPAIALIVVKWPQFARVMRGQVLAVKELPHVEAARVVGARPARIVFRHILPETLSPILTIGSSVFGNTILSIAGLSFLGLGAVPPSPEWGSMVSDAQSAFGQWWIGTFPGLAIISAVLSASFLGDGIRDVMDPRTRSE